MNMNMKIHKEIEKKYLILLPASIESQLRKYCDNIKVSYMIQTYLVAPNGERRIRMIISNKTTKFFYTEKLPVNGMTRMEQEREISREEYFRLMQEADPTLKNILKTRYTFETNWHKFELDVYCFSSEKAILEVELPTEQTKVHLPTFLDVLQDVTEDEAYKNHSLASSYTL